MFEAVKPAGLDLEHAVAELKSDLEIVLEAVNQIHRALQFVAAPLRARFGHRATSSLAWCTPALGARLEFARSSHSMPAQHNTLAVLM